jgi:predicted hydrocarbon binding protein
MRPIVTVDLHIRTLATEDSLKMKGIVMTSLVSMIQEKHGLSMWFDLLDETGLEGIYTAGDYYPDEEIVSLLQALSSRINKPVPAILHEFGMYVLPLFLAGDFDFKVNEFSFLDFLQSVDQVIHVEVKKLYPDAKLPSFAYTRETQDKLIIEYISQRKLCHLAEGLIESASEFFETPYTIKHDQCMLKGASSCLMEIQVHDHTE